MEAICGRSGWLAELCTHDDQAYGKAVETFSIVKHSAQDFRIPNI